MPSEISPKVAVPALILAALGVALLVLGVVLDSAELTAAGGGLLAASGIGGAAGYKTADPAREPSNAELALQRAGAPGEPPTVVGE